MPVEQALLPSPTLPALGPRVFPVWDPLWAMLSGSLLGSKPPQRLGIKAGYQLAVPHCLRPVPPKYSSDHTSFLGEGLAWTSELQGGHGGEERALLGFQVPEGPVGPRSCTPSSALGISKPCSEVSVSLCLCIWVCVSVESFSALSAWGTLWVPGTMCVRVCGCVVSLCLSLFLYLS